MFLTGLQTRRTFTPEVVFFDESEIVWFGNVDAQSSLSFDPGAPSWHMV